MWTNPVQFTIFENVFKDSDTFPMIPLVEFTAISHKHFGILPHIRKTVYSKYSRHQQTILLKHTLYFFL